MSQPVQIVCGRCSALNRVPADRLIDGPVCGKCRNKLFAGKPIDLNAGNFMRFIDQTGLYQSPFLTPGIHAVSL